MARKKRNAEKLSRPGAAEVQLPPGAVRAAAPALVVLFALFAWSQGGVYEDGFFYLRIADVFLHGGGLAYNPGERFETNTDFLWSLLLIPGPAVGVHDILWMQLLGVAIYAAALCATFILARGLFSNSESALLALILLGGHYSFAHFAASGFAPVLQALAALCCLLALLRFGESPRPRNGAAVGFALLFLALCRLDSAVFGLPLVVCALYFAWRGGKPALPGIALALGIPSVLFGGVLLWKLSYYGDIFPAPYYAKAAPAGLDFSDYFLARGKAYLLLYWQRYFLWLPAGAAAYGAWRILRAKPESRPPGNHPALLWTTAAMCVLWHGYMIRVGGDLYEFRLLMPQAPMLMILAMAGMRGLTRHWRRAATAAMVVVSLWHWQTAPPVAFPTVPSGLYVAGTKAPGLTPTRLSLNNGVRSEFDFPDDLPDDSPGVAWRSVALALSDLFAPLGEYPPQVRVGFSAGGLPAYVAPLLWQETRGWADSRIGQAGADEVWYFGPSIGHSILARPELMARLGVNLMFRPEVFPAVDFSRPVFPHENPGFSWAVLLSDSLTFKDVEMQFPRDSQLFALPLSNGRVAPILYLNRNRTIDQILDERGIERVNVF